jgi:hypothetical protein
VRATVSPRRRKAPREESEVCGDEDLQHRWSFGLMASTHFVLTSLSTDRRERRPIWDLRPL